MMCPLKYMYCDDMGFGLGEHEVVVDAPVDKDAVKILLFNFIMEGITASVALPWPQRLRACLQPNPGQIGPLLYLPSGS